MEVLGDVLTLYIYLLNCFLLDVPYFPPPVSAPEIASWANALYPSAAPHSRMTVHPGETCMIPEFWTSSLHTVMRAVRWAGGRRRQNGEQRVTGSRINQT